MERRPFVKYTAAAGASLMLHPFEIFGRPVAGKIRLAQVGVGHRGTGFWGTSIIKNFGDITEFVGIYDIPAIQKGSLLTVECSHSRACFVGVDWPHT